MALSKATGVTKYVLIDVIKFLLGSFIYIASFITVALAGPNETLLGLMEPLNSLAHTRLKQNLWVTIAINGISVKF